MTTIGRTDAAGPGFRLPTSPPVGFSLFVRGLPAPQGSKRAIVNRYTGKAAMIESSKRVAPWRSDVREAVTKIMRTPRTSPVRISLTFYLPRPKSHFGSGRNADRLREDAPRRPSGKPDVDKLARAVLDALTGTLLVDDSQVVTLVAQKWYAADRGAVGVMIGCSESES